MPFPLLPPVSRRVLPACLNGFSGITFWASGPYAGPRWAQQSNFQWPYIRQGVLCFSSAPKSRAWLFPQPRQEAMKSLYAKKHRSSRAWSLLPEELVTLFLSRLSFADHIRCSAVCKFWRMAADVCSHYQALRYPWLMFFEDQETDQSFGLFSLMEGQIYNLNLQIGHGTRCIGSSEGWLLMVDEDFGSNYLLHPFSGAKIRLPRNPRLKVSHRFLFSDHPLEGVLDDNLLWALQMREMARPHYLRKAILAPAPGSDHYTAVIGNRMVLAIYGESRLAFWRPGDADWSLADDLGFYERFHDIIFRDELVYAVTTRKKLMVLEFWPSFKATYFSGVEAPRVPSDYETVYLVESADDLLMVVRHLGMPEYPFRTATFNVYKLDVRGRRWVRMEELGNRALLVGAGCSISCLADESSGFRGNCIYFTDDNCLSHPSYLPFAIPFSDLGIFCLDGGQIQPLPPRSSYSLMSPAFWFTPGTGIST